MKKLFLLGALVCASQMYGMEPIEPKNPRPELGAFGYLPEDVHRVIIQRAIESSDTIEKAIQVINAASALRGVKYDNLKDFTTLVHVLADKFDMSTLEIASKFNTPIATAYSELGRLLIQYIMDPNIDKITELIHQGVDVNLTDKIWLQRLQIDETMHPYLITPLVYAKRLSKPTKAEYLNKHNEDLKKITEILIEVGAN